MAGSADTTSSHDRPVRGRKLWPATQRRIAVRQILSMKVKAVTGGFTLIELIVTIALVGVLAALALPGFNGIILNNRRVAAINEFVVAINHARTLAITQRRSVTLCRSNNTSSTTPTCATGTGYESGWVSFIEAGAANGSLEAAEQILRRHEPLNAGIELRGNGTIVNRITFNSAGITNNNGRITYCDSRGWSDEARIVTVSVGGRVRTVERSGDTAPLLTACN